MLKFAVLGSGSGGNSAVLRMGQTCILIDAGLSAKQLCLRLQQVGVDPDSIDAVVLTHEHSDHVSGVDVFCRKRKLEIYTCVHTCEMIRDSIKSAVVWKHFVAGEGFRVGEIEVESFSIPHDAVDPVGFVFRGRQSSLGFVSDIGQVTEMVRQRLKNVNTLFVEANYDELMLQEDLRRPWSIKQRISSRHGHLSNVQAAELAVATSSPALCRVILGHLSSDCNTSEVASAFVKKELDAAGVQHVDVYCATQKEPTAMRPVAESSLKGESPNEGQSEDALEVWTL
ncbi:MAG: MBL fold metallo-hydrolase [Verrucomicrobiales bacterium]|nr:MBL fold metallo-hydrolase [Verrucomicrobiales bacterium]